MIRDVAVTYDSRLLTEEAALRRCRRCGAPVLAAHTDGCPVVVDLVELDAHGELAALLLGRDTFDVYRFATGAGAWLFWREQSRMAAPRAWPVVARHVCPPGRRLRVPYDSVPPPEPRVAVHLLGEPLGTSPDGPPPF